MADQQETNIYQERLMEALLPPDFALIKKIGETLIEAGMAYVGDIDFRRMLSPSYVEPGLTQNVDKDKAATRY